MKQKKINMKHDFYYSIAVAIFEETPMWLGFYKFCVNINMQKYKTDCLYKVLSHAGLTW